MGKPGILSVSVSRSLRVPVSLEQPIPHSEFMLDPQKGETLEWRWLYVVYSVDLARGR
ncbi:MAG: hypothetical protein H6Q44_700 [Deltaproteobacteria bacterium]|nr:hypothetical protein [Deltaproteobacteria bacterium]